MTNMSEDNEKLLSALGKIATLLEGLFILGASRAGIKQQDIRAILRVDIGRVARIAKHIKRETANPLGSAPIRPKRKHLKK